MAEKWTSLLKLAKAGGPPVRTMIWRLKHGKYPKSCKLKGKWHVNEEDAIQAFVEWQDRREGKSIADVARGCGLKSVSLNQKAIDGGVRAVRVMGRWFIDLKEESRLRDYYLGTVTTSEAARRLGYAHRRSIHDLTRRSLDCVQIGLEKRIRESDIAELLRERKKRAKQVVLG